MKKKRAIGVGAVIAALALAVCFCWRDASDKGQTVKVQAVNATKVENAEKQRSAEKTAHTKKEKVKGSTPVVAVTTTSVVESNSVAEAKSTQKTAVRPNNAGDSSSASAAYSPDGTPVRKTGDGDWPAPAKSKFAGKTIAYRTVELPPNEKGGKPGELREWLIEPKEGYTAHIEEESRPDEKGEMQVVATREYVANQVLLTIDGETSFEDFKGKLEAKGAIVKSPLMELEKGAKIVAVMVPEISFDSVTSLREAVLGYKSDVVVEEDPIRTVNRVPNDVRYSAQWGLTKIKAPEAWNIRTNASSVVVAVIDSGVNYNHQDIIGNLWTRNSSATATNFKYGMRAYQGVISGNPMDDQGHGSNCAGIIGAVGNNSIGVSGVAWTTKIMACKNLFLTSDGRAGGSTSDMILCMEWARTNGAHIVSLSQGGGDYSSAGYLAFSRLQSAGIIAVCAAGNDGTDNDTYPHYPSSYSLANIVSVAATDTSDTLCTREKNAWSGGSNYGASTVDIAAPGDNILSIYHTSSTAYASMSGTSQATPFVAGALALLKAQYPSYTYLQLIQKLYAGGDAVAALSGMVSTGKRLNVYKALSDGQLVSPVPSASRGTYSDRVNVTWSSVSGATYYHVYRATSSTGTKTALGSWQTGTSYNDYSVTSGTPYYYWVCAASSSSGANQSAYGSYATGYAQASTGDSWDPGDNTPSGGTTITPTTSRSTHGVHTLGGTDTNDFFKVSLTANRRYIFETIGTHDTVGELYDSVSLSKRVAYNDDINLSTNRNFRIEYTPSISGTYYLRVRNINTQSTASGSYSLVYQYISAGDAWDSGDDTPSGGTLITPTTSVQTHGPHTLSPTDIYDFFRISMTAGRTYVFESTGTSDMYGELFNSTSTNAANRVAYHDDIRWPEQQSGDANFKLEYTPVTSGTYYLRVRGAGANYQKDASYSLKYSYSLPPAVTDIVFKQHDTWPTAPFFTTASDSMEPQSTFTTNEVVWVRYLWGEANWSAVSGPITNSIHVYNKATGAKIILIATEYMSGVVANNSMQGRWHFDTSRLVPGAYTAVMHLNEDHFENYGVQESTYTNNVVSLSFTVVNPQKTLNSIAISGNSSIDSKGVADYRCVGTYSDGSTSDVSPTWSITSGSTYASVSTEGRVTAGETTVNRTITLQAVFGGKTATKTITIRGTGVTPGPDPKPFADPVSYPNAPMVVEGVVYINNVLAAVGDQIAAYSGNEVRGVARIVANGRVTMGVNIAESGERISFKVWDASEGDNGTIYNCLQTLAGTSTPQGTSSSPVRFDAASSDPFGQVTPEPLVSPTIIEASVSVDGEPASAGDILAVFSGNTIVGKAPITYANVNGQASATCRVVMRFSGHKTLTFKLWDADKSEILDASASLQVSAGAVTGTSASPYEIAFSANAPVPCPVTLGVGWNLVSFSALPDVPTPENVFRPVADRIRYVIPGNASSIWAPGDTGNEIGQIQIGKGYWVYANNSAEWSVEGLANPDASISLSAGWNCIGYTLPRAGRYEDVLRTALASGKIRYVLNARGQFAGTDFTSLAPGVGYWVYANSAYQLVFDQSGMSTSVASMQVMSAIASGGSSFEHPFGEIHVATETPKVIDRLEVSLFGKTPMFGDVVAAYFRGYDETANTDTNYLVAVQRIDSEDGVCRMSLNHGNGYYFFRVWNAASGLERPEIFDGSGDYRVGNATPVDSYSLEVTGTAPSYNVTFNLDGKATRTGGGALTQTVAFGGNAVDPVITANRGWRFVDWDYSKRTDIRSAMTITALYEQTDDPVPETYTVTFDRNGGTGTMAEQTFTNGVAQALRANTFTRTGYTFAGWATSASGEVVYSNGQSVTLAANATLYAKWTANTYTVTFNANGGTVSPTTRQVVSGTAVGALPTPSRSNYTFDGWYTAASDGTRITASTVVTASVTYFAHWTAIPVNYTVTFIPNGGTVSPTSRLVASGAAVGTLPTPIRSGYMFAGWWTASSGGTQITPTTIVTANVSYYAHWISASFTLGGDANWSQQADGSWKSGTITDSQSTWIETTVSGEGTVSFTWKVSSEHFCDKLSFYVDGQQRDAISGTVDWSQKYVIVTGSGTHTLRWVYSKDGSVSGGDDCGWIKDYQYSDSIEPSMLSDLYPYTPTGWSGPLVLSASSQNSTSSTATSFSPNDSIFASFAVANSGAAFENDFEWALYVDESLRTTGANWGQGLSSNGSSRWTAIAIGPLSVGTHTVKVVYDYTGLVAESNEGNNIVTKTVTVSGTVMRPSNDDFANATVISGAVGSTAGSNINATYQPGEPLTAVRASATNTIWWTWTAPASGSVQFNTIASEVYDTVMGIYTGTSVSALTRVAANDDCRESRGYSQSSNSFTVVSGTKYHIAVSGGSYRYQGGIQLNWSMPNVPLSTYTVTFNANGGTGTMAVQTFTQGVAQVLRANAFTRTGYTFAGWATSASGAVVYTNGQSVTLTANATLYAKWTPNTYAVTFNANGGTVSPTTKTVTFDATYGTLPTPTRNGYTFDGWFTAASGGTQVTASTKVAITSAQTLYVHWTPRQGPVSDPMPYPLSPAQGLTIINGVVTDWDGTGPVDMIIPDGVTAIGEYVFHRAWFERGVHVRSVKLPDSLTRLGEGAFVGSNLEAIEFGAGLQVIEHSAFANTRLSGKIVLPTMVMTVGKQAFMGTKIRHIYLPASLSVLSRAAFEDCTYLVGVHFLGDAPRLDLSTDDTFVSQSTSVFEGCNASAIVHVVNGTVGWMGSATADLPYRWPLNDPNSLAVRGDESPVPGEDVFSDSFANATRLVSSAGRLFGSNANATQEVGEPLVKFASTAANTVWVDWTAPKDGVMMFSTEGSDIDTVMGVYAGASLGKLAAVAENDDYGASNLSSACWFRVTGGRTYHIAIAGYNGETGRIALQWSYLSGGVMDTEFSKAQAVNGALYDTYGILVGTVQLKIGKINVRKGTVKISATVTLLADGKVKKITSKAVTFNVYDLPRETLVFKAPIGNMTLEVAEGGLFSLSNDMYAMSQAAIGGTMSNEHVFSMLDFSDFDVPGELLSDLLPWNETFVAARSKWQFAKAATVKWAKPKKGAEPPEIYDGESDKGLIVDDTKGKTNLSGLKLTYTAKTGQFKGSFKAYALEEANGKMKLKKYTVNVIGFVVDGRGIGEARCKRPAGGPWTVTVE